MSKGSSILLASFILAYDARKGKTFSTFSSFNPKEKPVYLNIKNPKYFKIDTPDFAILEIHGELDTLPQIFIKLTYELSKNNPQFKNIFSTKVSIL